MKIMYVDASTDGHHLAYLNSLLQVAPSDSFAVLPECERSVDGRCRMISKPAIRKISGYWTWINKLKKIAKEEQPDIVHFLDGDSIMRYFGWGLSKFRPYNVVVTYHHFFPGKLREISLKQMLRKAKVGVFHTEEIANKVRDFGCKNVRCISYPCFLRIPIHPEDEYKNDPPVLLALGGTRYDKGLDILLEALKRVEQPFRLIIAGQEMDFDEKYIKEAACSYRSCVEWNLHFLTEQELIDFLQSSDIIVLPYRKCFDGASGPMCEGVYLGKMIIGPSHGSLGKLIVQHHVGCTFKSEDIADLTKVLNDALKKPFGYDETAIQYQKSLQPEVFQESYFCMYRGIECKGKK